MKLAIPGSLENKPKYQLPKKVEQNGRQTLKQAKTPFIKYLKEKSVTIMPLLNATAKKSHINLLAQQARNPQKSASAYINFTPKKKKTVEK